MIVKPRAIETTPTRLIESELSIAERLRIARQESVGVEVHVRGRQQWLGKLRTWSMGDEVAGSLRELLWPTPIGIGAVGVIEEVWGHDREIGRREGMEDACGRRQ